MAMKILSLPTVPEGERNVQWWHDDPVRCLSCGAVIQLEKSDSVMSLDEYIVWTCPYCNAFNNHYPSAKVFVAIFIICLCLILTFAIVAWTNVLR